MADRPDFDHDEQPLLPSRQQWGWFAWKATVGYIHDEYAPDATLMLEMYPSSGIVLWAGELTFGENRVVVRDRLGFAPLLADLWEEVSGRFTIFRTSEAAVRQPVGYADDEWVDAATLDALTRLVGVTSTVFKSDWRLMVYYRPAPSPMDRVHARLIARDGEVVRAGHGATLRDGCRNLFHNATPDYKRNTSRLSLE